MFIHSLTLKIGKNLKFKEHHKSSYKCDKSVMRLLKDTYNCRAAFNILSAVSPVLHLGVAGHVVEEEGGGVGGGVDPGQEEVLQRGDHVPGVQLPRGQPN